MSLFPAYDNEKNNDNCNVISSSEQSKDVNKDPEWLKNSSYQKISECLQASAKNEVCIDSSDEDCSIVSIIEDKHESIHERKHFDNGANDLEKNSIAEPQKEKQNRKIKKKPHSQYKPLPNDPYYEDKSRNKRLCTIETLEPAVRPRYKLSSYRLNLRQRIKSKREYFNQRYYVTNIDVSDNLSKTDKTKINDGDTKIKKKKADEIQNFELSDDSKMIIEEYNKKLAKCPSDVNIWIEYVLFQDRVFQLSPQYSEKKKFKQIINQKKLSIVEKGLTANRDSVELLKIKLQLMSELIPADQFSDQIEGMVQKDPKNIMLWQTLIMVIQTSCALCKVSKVVDLYAKCFPILKQKFKTNPKFYEKQALGLLYECLTFLRNVGLWEQMWETIRLNLCLNLALDHETLKDVDTIDEKALMSMEELILTSQLPLNHLWLRIESLRENCHWTSVNTKNVDINLIGDEKRLITAEEINDFIYPTISKESNFQLVISSILCLKVPLLPTRHCTLKDFNLDEHYRNIDSLEIILPMIYSHTTTVYIGEANNYLLDKNVLIDLLEGKLTSGPQYLKYHPAKESYIDFIRTVFNTAAQNLSENQKTSIFVWWLKFERLLIFFAKHDPSQETNKNKKLKSIIKNFLKKSENRNNLHYYREYALIENELGAFDSSVQILNTIILSQDTTSLGPQEKTALFSLYRTVFEILLDSKTYKDSNLEVFQEMARSLKNFISTNFGYDLNMTLEEMLYNEILKFLMNPVTDELEDAFLLPNIHCDLLICYVYLLFVKNNQIDNLNDILELSDKCLSHCEECNHLKERFYEIKIIFLQFYQNKVKKINNILTKTVQEALAEFPNNFYFLSINALIEIELPCWKLKTSNKNVNIWSIFARCLAGRARITYLKNIGVEESENAMINKMISFHNSVSKMQNLQGCPLLWRFYMLLLREHNLCTKKGEEIYYEAVNQCPWARSVYLSAAEIAPQILSQVQDLMKEKELRIHITPEELDILRE